MNTIKRIIWISSVILILVSSAGRGAHAAEAADKVPHTTQMEAGSLLVEAESAGSFGLIDVLKNPTAHPAAKVCQPLGTVIGIPHNLFDAAELCQNGGDVV